MDRAVVRELVEDYWRTLIPALQSGGSHLAVEIGQRFETRVDETAALLEPVERAAFMQSIEAERERLVGEYQADPVALKRRLGVPLGVDAPGPAPMSAASVGGKLAGEAVRTAVRATIWEGVSALFRSFR